MTTFPFTTQNCHKIHKILKTDEDEYDETFLYSYGDVSILRDLMRRC